MPRPSYNFTGEMTRERKLDFRATIGTLVGEYEIKITPRRTTRSGQQNRYFHGVVVQRFHEFLRDQDYEHSSREAAKALLKQKFLLVDDVNPTTGEVIGNHVRGTSELNSEEMSNFTEQCRMWLLDFFGIITEDPDPAWAAKKEKQSA